MPQRPTFPQFPKRCGFFHFLLKRKAPISIEIEKAVSLAIKGFYSFIFHFLLKETRRLVRAGAVKLT